ncbi:MAG: DUF2851 family protein [Odoribacteraceae bacterium]|jgi:hypothetical protein|nr:DUF2851 family protein [Odoribacteraceae bacterium]
MNEEFLQYIWANSLFRDATCVTTGGEHVRVLHVGERNRDSGPDFSNARVEKGGIILVGTVEVHLSGSDWFRHGHHVDPAYDNVILSVVKEADVEVYTSRGRRVDTVVLQYNNSCWEEYLYTRGAAALPRCHRRLREIDPSRLELSLAGYAIERLERKCAGVYHLLEAHHGDWEATLYGMITRYWSGNVNAEAFSLLARGMPYKTVWRGGDSLFRAEALLLGYSGLLGAASERDEHVDALREEYAYLASKHGLQAMPPACWKFMRVRPVLFPTVRIALLAALLCRSRFLFSALLEARSAQEAMEQFDVRSSPYWDTRYRLGQPSARQVKRVGKMLQQLLVVNALVPFFFVYGRERGEERYRERAIRWLEELPPESNRIVREWEAFGVVPRSAFQSQALLHVHKEYCVPRRCLHCKLGCEVFKVIE